MPAPKIALELIDRFDRNLDAYRSGHYKETQGKGTDGGTRKFFLEAKKPSIDIKGATRTRPTSCAVK